MPLEFKPDFETARNNWADFWQGKNKRPLIEITIPKPNKTIPPRPRYMAGYDGNFQPAIDQALAWADAHDFIGEAIPFYFVEFGPDTFAGFLGAELVPSLEHETSWCQPFVKDWDDIEIKFKPESIWWQRTADFIKTLRPQCDGKLLIAPPLLCANLDAIAAIRGIENLLMDLIECPEKIHKALADINLAYTQILDEYDKLLDTKTYGSINSEGFYTPGRQSRPQCDMSVMISEDMFKEFVVPALEYEASKVDAFVYHLDGPDAIKHLEALCGIENLDLITWVPGDGHKHKNWDWLHDKIASLGKGYGAYIGDHDRIRHLARQPYANKLAISTTAATKTQAEELIAELER
ncbi:MAG: hypothetical protein FWE42_02715 [Defluviitaleaceae bacterium]|nr:hypothetical protein [Defluviitaleaceae bacterium]